MPTTPGAAISSQLWPPVVDRNTRPIDDWMTSAFGFSGLMANGTPPCTSHCPPNGWKSPAWMRPLVARDAAAERRLAARPAGDELAQELLRQTAGEQALSTYPSMP